MTNTAAPPSKLNRLDAEIQAETDPVKRGCLRGERAGVLARQGSSDLARAALDSLQRDFGLRPDAAVSVWMRIAEGWLAHYNGEPAAALDRFKRGYALSTAVGNTDLRALTAAWLAHIHYTQDSFPEMVEYLKIAKSCARQNDNLTQARLCLVIAQSFHFANRFENAQPWYIKARNFAALDKDDSALSALSYNLAGRQAFYLVAASIFEEEASRNDALARTGLQSSHHFDQMFNISLVGAWVHIVKAMVHSVDSEFVQAIRLYETYLEDAMNKGLSHQKAFFKADMAWCHANIGAIERAKALAAESRHLATSKMYVEDRMLAFGRLGQVYSLLGDTTLADVNKKLALDSRSDLFLMQQHLLILMETLTY